MYSQLIENQWKYAEIDDMDIHGFLRLMSKNNDDKPSESKKESSNIEDFYNSI